MVLACSVCFGGNGPSADGAVASAIFLGGLVYTILAVGGVLVVVAVRRRGARGASAEDPGEAR